MIGRTLAHYEVEGRLGEGGMGEVYLAKDLKLGRRVALKVLPVELGDDPERLAWLEREARTLAAIDHPNIVTVFSVEEAEGIHFLTMAHVEGRTLAEMIPLRGLPLDRLLGLAVQLAEALRAAHEQGIVHRDLKPRNVMVDEAGRVHVLDFGLAKRSPAGAEAVDSRLPTEPATAEGAVLGTYPYMSPEQAEGRAVDPRSDIFSLGVILYEMAVGKRPFVGDSALSVLSSIVKDTPTSVTELRPDLPRHLGRVIEHCLAKSPERRYQSVLDVRNELEVLGKEVEIASALPAASSRRLPQRKRSWIGAAAIAGLLLLAGAGYWATSRDRPVVGAREQRIASVVVLPSAVYGGAAEPYLTDAIPRSLSTHLAQLPGLETKAPPTRLELDRMGGELDKIAGLYGVGAWVQSSITAEQHRFVLNVQLVDVASRKLLWSGEFEGARGAYIDLVREAAAAVGGWLRPAQAPARSVGGSSSSEAELTLRRGQFFSTRYINASRNNSLGDTRDFEAAREAFESLVRMGSHSVTASAELGWLYGTRFESGHVDALTEVERWGRRAVEVDPGSSLGWSVLAAAEGFRGFPDPQEALTYGLRGATGGSAGGRELNSLGNVLDFGGLSLDLALEAYGEAASIDPIHAYARSNAALTLLSLGRFEEALPYFDAALRIRPEDRWMYFGKWVALTRLGRAGEASAAWEGLLEIEGEEGPGAVIGRILEDLSKPGESSLQATRRLQRLLDDDSVLTEFNKIQVAAGLYPLTAGAAAIDLTFELIDLSIAGGWPPPYDLLALSPLFDPVRQDPRFAAALAEARRRFDLLRSVLDRARVRDELPGFLETPLADLLARLEAAGYLDASA